MNGPRLPKAVSFSAAVSRPTTWLLLFTCLFVGVIGWSWLGQPPSNQEMLPHYAKVQDYADAAVAMHGVPWWTPRFLRGSSLAFCSLGALGNLSIFAAAHLAGPYHGTKAVALVFLALCPWTMYGFVRRLCPGSPWTAFACAAAYLCSPSLLLRMGHLEHFDNVMAFAMLPISCWGVLHFLERKTTGAALVCAVGNALLTLAYAKIAVVFLPILGGFAAWAWVTRGRFLLPPGRAMLFCAGAFAVLAVLPNLPAAREMGLAAGFDFGPFAAWQGDYSLDSALGWFDRGGLLTGLPPYPRTEVRTPGNYLGLVGLFCAATLICLRRRPVWQTPEGTTFRVFIALALFANWFGLGIHSAMTGQLAFLARSAPAPDAAIALSYALLFLQGGLIWLLVPAALPARALWAAAAVYIYLFVPGFRLLEKLPLYAGIRMPHDFFEMGGVFCFAVAAGLAASLLLGQTPARRVRAAVGFALLVIAACDAVSCVPSFFKSQVSRATFDDFLAAARFLKDAPMPGGVLPLSGRYFYLLTPPLSSRDLITESYNGHFMQRRVAEMQSAAFTSLKRFGAFLDVAGAAYLLVDRQDPDTPRPLQDTLRQNFPVAYENEHFTILQNPTALTPASWSPFYLGAPGAAPGRIPGAYVLDAAALGLPVITGRSVVGDDRGLVSADAGSFRPEDGLRKLDPARLRRINPQEIWATPPAGTGWMLIPEAFHPDWQAVQGSRRIEIAPAFGGFLGVRCLGSSEPIRLVFRPPWWFALCLWGSLASWLLALPTLLFHRLGWLPAPARRWLDGPPADENLSGGFGRGFSEAPARISKPLVIIPTYNEAAGIQAIVEKVLTAYPGIEVLVVDDASPDGTAQVVETMRGPRVHLRERAGKLGLGSAYREGFRWAMENGFDACIEMDADFSHDPADIVNLLAALDAGADAAIGSRYLGGVRVINWAQGRLLLSLSASRFVRLLTGLPMTDATSGFKAIRSDALRKVDEKFLRADGYGFQIELHYFLWQAGARLVEVPIIFTERREGKTKMTSAIAFEALGRVLQLAIRGK